MEKLRRILPDFSREQQLDLTLVIQLLNERICHLEI